MSIGMILGLILGALGIGSGILGNVLNSSAVEDANAKNLKSVQDTNASNVEQAELAYKRSLPITQLRTLMDAGYSRAGAMSAISGAGSYTAPTLGSPSAQAKQFDMSSFQSSLERIGGIPSNVEQLEMMKTQRKLVEQEYLNNLREERRKQESHEYDMWQKMYNKNVATLTDAFNSRISNYAAQNNVDLSKINTKDDFVRVFGLKNDKEWHSLPKLVQDKFYQDAMNQARENREIQTQHNANVAANDAHIKALDELKNSEFGRTLSAKQIEKVEIETKRLAAEYGEYLEDMPARDKERKVREGAATLQSLLNSMEINKNEFLKSLRLNEDGTPTLDEKTIQQAGENARGLNTLWKMVMSIIGVDYLGDIIRSISLVSPK